jgi:hypothetical protein
VICRGNENPQGFVRGPRRVGVRVRKYDPWKTPTLQEGFKGLRVPECKKNRSLLHSISRFHNCKCKNNRAVWMIILVE